MSRADLPAEIVSLEDVLKVLRVRRMAHLEAMALGRPEAEYRELVGRVKEESWLIETIGKRVLQVRQEGGE
jgi:hypothetical protein